ncbi:MAG TPA: Arc family DNA-binding protein [Ktedonobacteraceae bacterium]|nr:Arc family DNA-binding protein [Ktedonobacteraceae bacterium]
MERKTEKQKVTVLIPAEIVAYLKQVAEQHQRSFNRELVWALQQYLEQQGNRSNGQKPS